MALTRQSCSFDYTSQAGSVTYRFTVQSLGGSLQVRNIQGPLGLIQDSWTGLPQAVLQDIQTALGQAEDTVAATTINGTLAFSNTTTASVVFVTALASTAYRVYLELPEFIQWRVSQRTVNGFTIELSHAFTGSARYDVMV